jgi:hypothetical protein
MWTRIMLGLGLLLATSSTSWALGGFLGKIMNAVTPRPSIAFKIYGQIVAAIEANKDKLAKQGITDGGSCDSKKDQVAAVLGAAAGIGGAVVTSDLGRCACKKAY